MFIDINASNMMSIDFLRTRLSLPLLKYEIYVNYKMNALQKADK